MVDIQQPPWTFTGAENTTLEQLSDAASASAQQQVDNTLASTATAMDGLISTLSNVQSVQMPSFNFNSLTDVGTPATLSDAPGSIDWSYTVNSIAPSNIQYTSTEMGELLTVPITSVTPPVAPAIASNAPDMPNIQSISHSCLSAPAGVSIGSVSALSIGAMPILSATAPDVNIPSAPSAFGKSAPSMDALPDRSYPDAPNRSLPGAPIPRSFDLPDAPDMLDIEFSVDAPLALDAAPDVSFSFNEVVYDSDLLDTLKTKLLDLVQNARQSGLNNVITQQIMDAGRLRSVSASNGLASQVNRHFARMGWQPSDYSVERLFEAQEFLVTTDITENRSAALILSDLEQKNFQFAIGKSVELEGMMIDLHNKVQQRSFEAAKAIINAAVSVYKLKASYFNTGVAIYSAHAQVYKSRIQAELSKVEIYRTQIEGQKLISELNTQAIDSYKAQIAAVVALHGLYNVELEAVKTKLDGDSLKIKMFEAAIDAFSAEIQAKAIEYEGYKTAMQGEGLKARIFDSLVSAYGAQIEAYSTGIDAQVIKLDADVKSNVEAPLKISEQAVKEFTTIVDAESKCLKAMAKNDDVAVDLFAAMIDAEKSRVANIVDMYSAEISAFKAVNAGESARIKIIADTNSTSADIYKSQVTAGIANINSIVAMDSNKVDIASALAQRDIADIDIGVAYHKASVARSNASITGKAELTNAEADMNKVMATKAINKMEASLDIAMTEIDRSVEEKEQAIRTMIAAAQAQAQIIAANASTVNLHTGYTESNSESTSVSVNSFSYSENDSTTIQG